MHSLSLLVVVHQSPWQHVYSSRDDQAMIMLARFDIHSSQHLLGLFANIFDENSPFVDDEGYIVKMV